MNTKTTSTNLDMDPDLHQTIGSLDGDTLILDQEGNLTHLSELACEYQSTVQVICLDKHGRMTTAFAHSFRIGEWADQIYKITLTNGHVIKATKDQMFMGANGDWIKAEDLSFGTTITAALYDPTQPHPTKTIHQVEHIHKTNLNGKQPTYSFDVTTHNNLLVAHQIEENISLIPAHIGVSR